MPYLREVLVALAAVTIGLILLLSRRPELVAARGGRILAFIAFFLLPIGASVVGFQMQVEYSKTTEFCLSCHVMEPYGKSLQIDDSSAIPAQHFQNARVPRDHACFTCHTTYAMFGDLKAKMGGLRHMYHNYIGTIPEKIELYEPYKNRECLHCHGGARTFEESDMHKDIRADLESNATSCLECHNMVHDVAELDKVKLWKP